MHWLAVLTAGPAAQSRKEAIHPTCSIQSSGTVHSSYLGNRILVRARNCTSISGGCCVVSHRSSMGNEASTQRSRTEEASLRAAAASGDATAVEAMLKQTPGLVYAHTKAGENLWHLAAESGHTEVVRLIAAAVQEALALQNKQERMMAQVGAAANNVNKAVSTFIASTTAPLPAAMALPMGRNISIDAPTRDGLTPLMRAVALGKLEIIQALLEAGADPWVGDASGRTVLHHAAMAGQLEVAKLLLTAVAIKEEDAPANECLVNASSGSGLTALHCACWAGAADLVKLLVNSGARLDAATHRDSLGDISCNAGSTPLHLAAMKAEWPVVRLLLRATAKLVAMKGAGAELRLKADTYGKLAYDLAADLRKAELAEVLNPTTPLDVAIARTAGRAAERPAPRASADTGASHHTSSSARGSDPSGNTQRALGASISSRAKGGGDSSQGEGGILGGLIRAVRRSSSTGGRAGAGSGGGAGSNSPADAAAERLRGMALAAEQQQAARSEGAGDAGGAPPPDQLVCPITNDLFKDPVEAADGRVYERDAIEVWFALGNKQFPGGHAAISSTALKPRPDLAAEAAAWKTGASA